MERKFSVDCLNKNFGQSFQGKYLTHIGTPLYQAPEISGLGTYTEGVDIWGIGVIMAFGLFNETIHQMLGEETKNESGHLNTSASNREELINTIGTCLQED